MDISVERVFTKGDELVADAARSSFDRTADNYTEEQNRRLLNFLARAEPPHWTPFGHVRITIRTSLMNASIRSLIMNDKLTAGLHVIPAESVKGYTLPQYYITHSIWGWRNMLEANVFSESQAADIRRYLNGLPGLQQTRDALGLSGEAVLDPCEHVVKYSERDITLRIRCPIVIARQLFKHQVGFVYSEASGRYITYSTINDPLVWCSAPDNKKQGAGAPVDPLRYTAAELVKGLSHLQSRAAYWFLRKVLRIAPEQARFVMPMATDTTFVVTGSIEGWTRLLEHRLEEGAQREIRALAADISFELNGWI